MQSLTYIAGRARRLIRLCFVSLVVSMNCAELSVNPLDPGNPEGVTPAFLNWLFLYYDAVLPRIESSSPSPGKTDVVATSQVSVTFTEFMARESLNKNTFLLYRGGDLVSGSVTYHSDNRTVYFTPEGGFLENGMNYVVQLTRDVQDLAGNRLEDVYTFVFQVYLDDVPPMVIATTPANGAVDVQEINTLSVTFSEDMDASTVNAETISLLQDGKPVAGRIDFVGRTATFTPEIKFDYKMSYRLMIGAGVKDISGNGMAAAHYVGLSARNAVFVFDSEEKHDGNLGGRPGADAICRADYNLSFAGLNCNSVHALISINKDDSIRKYPGLYGLPVNLPVKGTEGGLLANDWSLFSNSPLNMSFEDANVTQNSFWTGASVDGGSNDINCGEWNSNAVSGDFNESFGLYGSESLKTEWLYNLFDFTGCRDEKKLLCVCWR